MISLLFLLLPIAAFSGWYVGRIGVFNNKITKTPIKYFSGVTYLLNEDPDKAIKFFLEALQSEKVDSIDAHLTIGHLFRKSGEVDKAIKMHQGLLSRTDLNLEHEHLAKLELAKDFISAGVLDRAEKLLLTLDNSQIKQQANLLLLDIYQRSKDWQRAITIALTLQKISKEYLSPKIANFYCELAEQYYLQGNYELSYENINSALKIYPECVRASILEGNIEISRCNYQSALTAYQRVFHQNPGFFHEVVENISKCFINLKIPQAMLTYLKSCVVKRPIWPVILSYSDCISKYLGEKKALQLIVEHLNYYPSIQGLARMVQLNLSTATGDLKHSLIQIKNLLDKIMHDKPTYKCENCGLLIKMLQWRCPSCKEWDSIHPIYNLELHN